MGHRFLALVDKHFLKDHKLRKIFNRNTIKISYSCMNNTKQIIDNHNKCILNSSKHINDTADNTNTKDSKTCNCRQKNTCPLNGNCLQSSLIYQATVTRKDNSTTVTYIGLTENDFKTRYRNHSASFRQTKLGPLPNSANISGPLKKITLTTIIHGASFHQDRPTTARTKDATSASKKNYSSFADPNYHHSINVMSSCPHAATETKRYCVTIEVLFLCKFIKYIKYKRW